MILSVLLSAEAASTDDPNANGILLLILTIIGGIAGLQQLASLIIGRRQRRAQQRLLSAAADRFDSEEEERRLTDLKALTAELEVQIRTEIPRAARQSYLLEQRAHLENSLRATYEDLSAVDRELEHEPVQELDPEIRRAIEDRISQSGAWRNPVDRSVVRWLALVIIASSLIPYVLNIDYFFSVEELFYRLTYSGDYGPVAVGSSILLGVIAIKIGLYFIGRIAGIRRLLSRIGTDRLLRFGFLVLSLGLALLLTGGLYAKHENDESVAESSRDLPLEVSVDDPDAGPVPENVPFPQVSVPNPEVDFERLNYDDRTVAVLLWTGMVITAIGLALSASAIRTRRVRAPAWQGSTAEVGPKQPSRQTKPTTE